MIAQARTLLAECHLDTQDKLVKVLCEAGHEYLIQRAKEELMQGPVIDVVGGSNTAEADRRLKLAIQLINLARVKIKCTPSSQSGPSKTARKRKSKQPSSTGSKPATGT